MIESLSLNIGGTYMYNQEDKDDFNEANLSSYNESQYKLDRIHYLKIKANNIMPSGNLDEWKWILDLIFIELSSEINRVKGEEELRKIDIALNNPINTAKNRAELFEALRTKQMQLNILQDICGMGVKTKGSTDYDMD